MLDFDTCNEARLRRDPTFDGLFFVAVKTTRIYCRPVCKVRQPLTKNICFFPSSASAEHSGYRPCLRCRPETAPFCPIWKGTQSTVEQAMRLILDGKLNTCSVAVLAETLGIGARQLTRLFNEHLGASPSQVAITSRIQRAKRMLDETELQISEISKRAGFPSVRRMNAAFAALYGRPPSALRSPFRTVAGRQSSNRSSEKTAIKQQEIKIA
jgi:AraC family transcriptional regulator, regulatory protein of adaptative response / methylated-DNA-[protein]-cysteine methyltransferase